jgi:hypothetical protein
MVPDTFSSPLLLFGRAGGVEEHSHKTRLLAKLVGPCCNDCMESAHRDEHIGKSPPSLADRLTVVGAAVGALVPLIHGSWTYYSLRSLPPPPPGQAYCGMPVIGAIMEIMIGPLLGCPILAGAGWLIGTVVEWQRRNGIWEPQPRATKRCQEPTFAFSFFASRRTRAFLGINGS